MSKRLVRVILTIAALGAFAWFALLWREQRVIASLVRQIAAHVPVPPGSSDSERFDALRVFVNSNSQHKLDDEFFGSWRDHKIMLRYLLDTVQGRRKPVHADCSMRSAFMHYILNYWGYRTRTVWIYATSKNLDSHTLLDVLNPSTQTWESQDPLYNVYWRHAAKDQRSSIVETAADLNLITPCNGTECGYQLVSREGYAIRTQAEGYFEILSVVDRMADRRFTVFTPRAEVAKSFVHRGRTGTYCQVLAKNCKDGIFPISSAGPQLQGASAP